MTIPKLTFRYSHIYDRVLYNLTSNSHPQEGYFTKRKLECEKNIQLLENHLKPLLPDILKKISGALGVSWKNEEIIVYVLPNWHKSKGPQGFSDPLTVILHKGNNLLDIETLTYTLIHELCHVIQRPLKKTNYFQEINKKINLKNIIVTNHILTFSLIKKVIGDKEYYRFTKIHHDSKAYKTALDLVERIGEDEVILEAKKYLKKNY